MVAILSSFNDFVFRRDRKRFQGFFAGGGNHAADQHRGTFLKTINLLALLLVQTSREFPGQLLNIWFP